MTDFLTDSLTDFLEDFFDVENNKNELSTSDQNYQNLQENRRISNGLDYKDDIKEDATKMNAKISKINDDEASCQLATSKLSDVEINKNELSTTDHTYQNIL